LTHPSSAQKKKFRPKILKELMTACDITQIELASATGLKTPSINLVANRDDYMPVTRKDFKATVEKYVSEKSCCMAWLKQRGFKIADIWKPMSAGETMKWTKTIGHGIRTARGMQIKPLVLGDPSQGELTREVEMLTLKAMKYFRFFKNPFPNNIDPGDAFIFEELRYAYMAMEEAIESSGMVAVVGAVGCGKSTARRLLSQNIKKKDNIRLIYPRIVDKTRITAASICDAIILDLDPLAKPKNKLEQKSRQVEALLMDRSNAGLKLALVLEEAQDLVACPRVLKLFKRFNEFENGYKKILGIILIGQEELGDLLNEGDYYDMREVIRRIQVANIGGLNGQIKDYLLHVFKKVKPDVKLHEIINDKAIEALSRRLMSKDDRQKDISIAYPLTVNNHMVRAMNAAVDHGEDLVTEEVINTMI
jgi:type II secretory pathway predicted ATPase ExeA